MSASYWPQKKNVFHSKANSSYCQLLGLNAFLHVTPLAQIKCQYANSDHCVCLYWLSLYERHVWLAGQAEESCLIATDRGFNGNQAVHLLSCTCGCLTNIM